MWNSRNINPPPTCELKVVVKPECKGVLNEARSRSVNALKVSKQHLKFLETELFVAKKVIYKLSNQFRSDRVLKSIRQVNTCLKRLKGLNLLKQLEEFHESVGKLVLGDDPSIYLPSRQFFEYQLVGLQGTGALLRQTANYSQKTFLIVQENLKLGNMISHNVVMLALCSRVWFVCNSLCMYVCEWYHCFYKCLDHLKPTTVQWLPDGEVIPPDIKQWLSEMFGEYKLTKEHRDYVKEVTGEEDDNKSCIPEVSITTLHTTVNTIQNEDCGVVISRSVVHKFLHKSGDQRSDRKDQKENMKRKCTSCIVDSCDDNINAAKVPKLVIEENMDISEENSLKLKEPVDKVTEKPVSRTEHLSEKGDKIKEKSESSSEVVNTPANVTECVLRDSIQTSSDIDGILEQVKKGSVIIDGAVYDLNNNKKSQILNRVGKIKNAMKDKMNTFMGSQMYVQKVKNFLAPMFSNMKKVNLWMDCEASCMEDSIMLGKTDGNSNKTVMNNETENKNKIKTEIIKPDENTDIVSGDGTTVAKKKNRKKNKKKKSNKR
ncbi:hypothetical protein ACF0H5_003225 [Mactra antiquata]